MEKEELEDIKYKIVKVKQLRKELMSIQPKILADTVQASSKIKPYALHTVKIVGSRYTPTQNKRKNELKRQINILEKEIKHAEYRIKNIDNKEISDILLYKYIKNYSWYKIQILMEYGSVSKAKMKVKRYLKKYKKI
jgi:hypothetical protein